MITNPFVTYGYEGPEYFCDRVEETRKLTSLLVNGNNTVLISPRRMGKTGILHHCFQQEQVKNNYNTFIIDIYATKNINDMTIAIGKSILNSLKPFGAKAIDRFLTVVSSLRAGVSFDSLGTPSISVDLGTLKSPQTTLDEIFHFISLSEKPCIIAIDEFQQIMYYPEKNVEAILRTFIQDCRNAVFVFSGSERHLLTEMFHSPSRPFYASTSTMPLGSIDLSEYRRFAVSLFETFDRTLDSSVVDMVYQRFEGITWFVQKVMNYLFKNTPIHTLCTCDMIEDAIGEIINDSSNIYADLLYQLTSRQKELLIAINHEGKATEILSSHFRKKYNLPSASTIQTTIKALMEKQIVTSNLGVYELYDKFFALWLSKQ